MEELKMKIGERLRIEDRLAIVRLENLGLRSNGYQITAMGGERCDACIVIHGNIGASFDDNGGYPVSASFYTNSFLHRSGGIFDLTLMATLLDPDGGGHANACGCRIQPIGEHGIENRQVSADDIQRNIELWQKCGRRDDCWDFPNTIVLKQRFDSPPNLYLVGFSQL